MGVMRSSHESLTFNGGESGLKRISDHKCYGRPVTFRHSSGRFRAAPVASVHLCLGVSGSWCHLPECPSDPPPNHQIWRVSNGARDQERCQEDIPPRSPLVSCLLFYQAFRSWPSAPRRLICQTGFHLHLQDATNLPFIPPPPPTGQFVKMAASHPHHQIRPECWGRLHVLALIRQNLRKTLFFCLAWRIFVHLYTVKWWFQL